jgi:hypothetical protein
MPKYEIINYSGAGGQKGRSAFHRGRASAQRLFSPLATRHSPLVTHHCLSGVSPTLKVSNHYEPNHRYHMNISKRPVCPDFFVSSSKPLTIER